MTEPNLSGLALLHQQHAEAIARLGPKFGVLQILAGATEYGLIELAAGFAPDDVEFQAVVTLETSPAIKALGLDEFAVESFQGGFKDRLQAIHRAREHAERKA